MYTISELTKIILIVKLVIGSPYKGRINIGIRVEINQCSWLSLGEVS
jgi:hypothetical protein